jgi:hypothetical protein
LLARSARSWHNSPPLHDCQAEIVSLGDQFARHRPIDDPAIAPRGSENGDCARPAW